MSDDEVVASYVPPRYLFSLVFLFFFFARRCPALLLLLGFYENGVCVEGRYVEALEHRRGVAEGPRSKVPSNGPGAIKSR